MANNAILFRRAHDLGIIACLIKPVAFDKLVQLVKAPGMYWTGWNESPQLRQKESA